MWGFEIRGRNIYRENLKLLHRRHVRKFSIDGNLYLVEAVV